MNFIWRRTLVCLVILVTLTAAIFLVFRKAKPIIVIEPESGIRKVRYSDQKRDSKSARGQVLYKFLHKGDQERGVTKILPQPEGPLSKIVADSNRVKQRANQQRRHSGDVEVLFTERSTKALGVAVPTKLYRVQVLPIAGSEDPAKLWLSIKAKNPLFFSKLSFVIDKKCLPDGKVVQYLCMGDYQSQSQAKSVFRKLKSVGYSPSVYEVIK